MQLIENYLNDLQQIYSTGSATKEESFYGALENLLNQVGKSLSPKIRCVPQLKNMGAGEPDFGLYTATQFQHTKDSLPVEGQPPERGVIEVKGWDDDSFVTAQNPQVSKYWNKYALVLVTNYHDFVLIGRDDKGKPVRLETYRMAQSANAFRAMLAHPRKTAQEQGDRITEFLKRVMLHNAHLTDPEDVAWFMASYAREARARVEGAADLPALEGFKRALEEALGMKFEGEKGEHFFRATLVQTLFYGIFSSWVLWSRENKNNQKISFNWHEAGWTLHVPMIASLFSQIATPQKLKPLKIDEVLDWAGTVLNRVDGPAFFAKFEEEHAVQYFYEPFLKAYDPELRKDLGVWYTPSEIVKYQVERVDRALRDELGIEDGLADEGVIILDPCCGTGAYLVETLRRIYKTFEEQGVSGLSAHKLKRAAMERVFGFEILPAPFVVSHLQIGLLLRQIGAPLNLESNERAGVYLTNALTGWEPLQKPKTNLPLFPELMEESDAAEKVKQHSPILVILGNPPYNAFAGTSPDEEGDLVETYKEGLTKPVKVGGWGIKKFNLDELYVRFFRIAERRIVKSGKGIVSYISNFSYLSDPSFVVMRKKIIEEFDKIWIDCMNGDSRETGKLTPDGKPDPSVFSTERNPVGIRVGTAICIMVRKEDREAVSEVLFKHHWGNTKRLELLDSLRNVKLSQTYKVSKPTKDNRFSFRPSTENAEYEKWFLLTSLCAEMPFVGLEECRAGALIDIDKEKLEKRIKMYCDPDCDWEVLKLHVPRLTQDSSRFDSKKTREKINSTEKYQNSNFCKLVLRPFDIRWCYHTTIRNLWNEPRSALREQYWDGNAFIVSRFNCQMQPEGMPMFYTRALLDKQTISRNPGAIPILLKKTEGKGEEGKHVQGLFGHKFTANLSENSRVYLDEIGIKDPDKDFETAGLIWMHSLAMTFSPAYLKENADGIRSDWPRIPLPKSKGLLLISAELGKRIAALLDAETQVKHMSELNGIGVISKSGGGALDPAKGHLDVTAGWGHAGKDGVCMPGKGRYEIRKQTDEFLLKSFGEETLDVFLNDVAYWANIPQAVWEYHIGGYQIIKKWLSYREKSMLGRGLETEEALYVTDIARRIAALILLQKELDINYFNVKANTV